MLATMAKHGLKRGDGAAAEAPAVTASSNGPHPGLKIHIMCESAPHAAFRAPLLPLKIVLGTRLIRAASSPQSRPT